MVAFGLYDTVCAGLPRVRWAPHEYAGRTICLADRIGRRSGKAITIMRFTGLPLKVVLNSIRFGITI
jgi:hypothetical protein